MKTSLQSLQNTNKKELKSMKTRTYLFNLNSVIPLQEGILLVFRKCIKPFLSSKYFIHGRLIAFSLVILICVGCSKSTPPSNDPDSPPQPRPEEVSPPAGEQGISPTKEETPSDTSKPSGLADGEKGTATLSPTDPDPLVEKTPVPAQQEGTPSTTVPPTEVDDKKATQLVSGESTPDDPLSVKSGEQPVSPTPDDPLSVKPGEQPISPQPDKPKVAGEPSSIKESEQDRTEQGAGDVLPGSIVPPLENICSFPGGLKRALESKLNKSCSDISSDDLSQIKTLKIENINQEEVTLMGKEYGGYFRSLTELDLSNNPEMLSLPGFVQIPALKKLDVSRTGIKNFGPEMCEMQTLEILKSAHNTYQGNEMPLAIVCLSQLKELDLSYSGIQYIDEYIYYLKELEKLNLRGNKLMNTPVMVALMPSLSVLDLRENQFQNEPVNSLVDCSNQKTSADKKKCKEELSNLVHCEYWHELRPSEFIRGAMGNQSYQARYEEMTGEKYKVRSECIDCADCYNSWINDYVFFGNPDDPKKDPETDPQALKKKRQYLLDLTINGKTIREWRLAMDAIGMQDMDYWPCHFRIKGVSIKYHGLGDSMYHFLFPKNTDWGPDSHEVHPERYRAKDWVRDQEKCKPINFNTPLPTQDMGPWSKALPAVQDLVAEKYLDPKWELCENWPTSVCSDKDERKERGENYGGLTYRPWTIYRDDCNKECESYLSSPAHKESGCEDVNLNCEDFCADQTVYLLETDSFAKQVEKSIERQCVRPSQED